MKKIIWTIIAILVISIVGYFLYANSNKQEGTKVSAAQVTVGTITETVTASGKIFPEVEVKVSPDISGEIVELNINEGDTVKKGQVVAKIYADIYASQRDQANAGVLQAKAQVANSKAQLGSLQATLNQAKNAFNRQKKLLEDKVISQQEFEQAEQAFLSAQATYNAALEGIIANNASVKSAVAGLQRADKDVTRATLVAPMDGVISLLNVKKGERVSGNSFTLGTEMMRIADLNSIELQVEVGENDITKVKLGDTAIIEVDAYKGHKFKGLVYKIANPPATFNLTTEVTNYKVHIRLLYSSYKYLMGQGRPFPFRPNMSASASIQTTTRSNIIIVPLAAVTTRDKIIANNNVQNTDTVKGEGSNKYNNTASTTAAQPVINNDVDEVVFILQNDNTVRGVRVTTGIQDIRYIEIQGGLSANDKIITGPNNVISKMLGDGSKVIVVPPDQLFTDNK